MDRIKILLKKRPARIATAACAAAAVLAAVFFLQPGPGKGAPPPPSAGPAQEETAALTQQAQGLLIDVDAALRQTQPAVTTAPLASQSSQWPVVTQTLPAVLTTVQATAAATRAVPTTTAAATKAPASSPATTASTTSRTTSTTATTTTTTTATTTTTRAQLTCTIAINCGTILANGNMDKLSPAKQSIVPSNGIILQTKTVSFTEGESVFDALRRVTQSERIHMDFESNPMYSSVYIAAVGNLYERDCGELSGWMYRVNGTFPNYGCSKYTLKAGDTVELLYTCDLGKDIGGEGISQRG